VRNSVAIPKVNFGVVIVNRFVARKSSLSLDGDHRSLIAAGDDGADALDRWALCTIKSRLVACEVLPNRLPINTRLLTRPATTDTTRTRN
jgi:hypothetical protein